MARQKATALLLVTKTSTVCLFVLGHNQLEVQSREERAIIQSCGSECHTVECASFREVHELRTVLSFEDFEGKVCPPAHLEGEMNP